MCLDIWIQECLCPAATFRRRRCRWRRSKIQRIEANIRGNGRFTARAQLNGSQEKQIEEEALHTGGGKKKTKKKRKGRLRMKRRRRQLPGEPEWPGCWRLLLRVPSKCKRTRKLSESWEFKASFSFYGYIYSKKKKCLKNIINIMKCISMKSLKQINFSSFGTRWQFKHHTLKNWLNEFWITGTFLSNLLPCFLFYCFMKSAAAEQRYSTKLNDGDDMPARSALIGQISPLPRFVTLMWRLAFK